MSYSPLPHNNRLIENQQLNMPMCNCCTCHCVCCNCHCPCPCHQNNIPSNMNMENNNNNIFLNNNLIPNDKKYPSYHSIKVPKNNNSNKISNDLNSFNQELMILKNKLLKEKKEIRQFPSSLNIHKKNSESNNNIFYIPKNYVKTDFNTYKNIDKEKQKIDFYSLLNSIKGNEDYNVNYSQRSNCNDCGNNNDNSLIKPYNNQYNIKQNFSTERRYPRNDDLRLNLNYSNNYSTRSPCQNKYSTVYNPCNTCSDYENNTSPNTYRKISPSKPSYSFQRIPYKPPIRSPQRNYIPVPRNKNNKDNIPNKDDIKKDNEVNNLETNERVLPYNQNYISTNVTDNNDDIYKNNLKAPKYLKSPNSNDFSFENFDFEIIGDNNNKDFIISELNNKILDLQNQLKNPSDNIKDNNSYYEGIIQEQKNKIENLNSELLKSNNDNDNLNQELLNIKNLLSHNKSDDLDYKKQLFDISNDNQKLIKELNNLKEDLNKLENEKRKLNQDLLNSQNNNSELENNNKNLNSRISDYQNKLTELEEENKKLMEQIIELKKNINTLIEQNNKLQDERIGDQKNISDLIEKNKIFNQQVIDRSSKRYFKITRR